MSGELIVTFVAAFGNYCSQSGMFLATSWYEPLEEILYILLRSCFFSVPSIVMPILR